MSLSLNVRTRAFEFALKNLLRNFPVCRTSPDFDDIATNLKITNCETGVIRFPCKLRGFGESSEAIERCRYLILGNMFFPEISSPFQNAHTATTDINTFFKLCC